MAIKKSSTPRPKRAPKASAASNRVNAPVAEPVAAPEALSLTQNKLSGGRILRGILIAVAVVLAARYLWKHRPAPAPEVEVPLPGPAKANLAWGPKVKLQLISKFNVGGDILAIKADAQGNVFVLNRGRISSYRPDGTPGVGGGGLDLPAGAEWENMAFDGNHFYVTFGNDTMLEVAKDLSKVERTIHVRGSEGLFGVAVSPKGAVLVGDEIRHTVFILDSDGKKTGQFGSPALADGSMVCPLDLAFDEAGGIYTHDHVTFLISHFTPDGKLIASWPVPWSTHNWERFCILQGKIYIDGFNDHRVLVQDLLGHNIAQCVELSNGAKLEAPQMIGAGLDGCLYVNQANTIFKLKPWDHPSPVPPQAAPAAVSPSAAKKG